MSCESNKYFKPGMTFVAVCTVPTVTSGITSLDGYTVTSAVKTSDGVRHMADSVTVDGMVVTVRINDTRTWPLGIAQQDLLCKPNDGSPSVYTRTWSFPVEESITPTTA